MNNAALANQNNVLADIVAQNNALMVQLEEQRHMVKLMRSAVKHAPLGVPVGQYKQRGEAAQVKVAALIEKIQFNCAFAEKIVD